MKTMPSPSVVVLKKVILLPSARVEEGSWGIAKGDSEYLHFVIPVGWSFIRNAANNQLPPSVIVAALSRLRLRLLPSQPPPVRVL